MNMVVKAIPSRLLFKLHPQKKIMGMFKMLKSVNTKEKWGLICLLMIISVGILVHMLPIFWNYKTDELGKEEDIYYLWIEGKRILLGENPYARILMSNMRDNKKYATYFPFFYIMSYLTQLLGLNNYQDWISFWRYIFLVFNLGVGLALFNYFYQKRLILISIFSCIFWLFNRWNFYVTLVADIDFIPIFFLLISLFVLRKRKWLSLIFFSISLAIKQIGVFLIPLYLIWIWHSANKNKIKQLLIAIMVISSIPLLTSIPFIIWSAESLVKSVLFSATRHPDSDFGAFSVDTYIASAIPQFIGLTAKLPMLFMMSLIYLIALKRQIEIKIASLLVMIVFIDFNSVLFNQYMCWVVPLIPLAITAGNKENYVKRESP